MGQESKKMLYKDWKEEYELYSLRKKSLLDEKRYLQSVIRTYQAINPEVLTNCEKEILELVDANYDEIHKYNELVSLVEEKIAMDLLDDKLLELFKQLKNQKISALPDFYDRVHLKLSSVIEEKLSNRSIKTK